MEYPKGCCARTASRKRASQGASLALRFGTLKELLSHANVPLSTQGGTQAARKIPQISLSTHNFTQRVIA
jgi:hypothetical protein